MNGAHCSQCFAEGKCRVRSYTQNERATYPGQMTVGSVMRLLR